MANIDKIVVTWNGFIGAPGYTVLYASASQGQSLQSQVVSMFQSFAAYFNPAVVFSVAVNGPTIDEATGKMVNAWTGGGVNSIPGTATAQAYSSTSGALVRFETGRFQNGRRVRGRMFLVPIAANTYSQTGTITPSVANAIKAAADKLLTLPGQLVVYSRPIYDNSTSPPTLKRPGSSFPVTSTTCPTKVTYLSSRRD
jgi:hypothetical protein